MCFHSHQEGRASGCTTGARSDLENKFNINMDEVSRKYIQISMTHKMPERTIKIANIDIPPRGSANYNDEDGMQNLIKASARTS